MPAGDRTGPNGLGPRTGRGAGLCNGNNVGGFANRTPRAGRGPCGGGMGFGAGACGARPGGRGGRGGGFIPGGRGGGRGGGRFNNGN